MASHRQAQAGNHRSNPRLARTNNAQTLKQSKVDKKAAKLWRRKIGDSAKAIPVTDGPNKERHVAFANEVAQLRQLGRHLQISSPHASSDHEEVEIKDPLHQLLSRMPRNLHDFTIERLQPIFDHDLSISDLAGRLRDVATSLQQLSLPPRQQISVQAEGVVSPPDQRASATTRTSLRQSFYQPFQSHAHDVKMLHIIATEIQNYTQSTSRMRDKPSDQPPNQPQSQAYFDQPQTCEPRIPLQPPLTTFSPQELRQKPQAPRHRFEKKAESEAQTLERGSSIARVGEGWKDAVSISSDNTSHKRPASAIFISSGVTTSSPYKSSSPPSNGCSGAQTQTAAYGGEARLPQATVSEPPPKKVRVLLQQDYSVERSVDVKEELVEKGELINDEHDELADEELHESLLVDIHMAEQNADDDQELLDELLTLPPAPNMYPQSTIPSWWGEVDRLIAEVQQLDQPASLDISRTQQHQTPQPSSVSQDSERSSHSKFSQELSAGRDIPRMQQRQSLYEPLTVQDAMASSDSYYADMSQSPHGSSVSQDSEWVSQSKYSPKPSAVQDAPAAQDTAHAQLSQRPQVSSPARDNSHAPLSQPPPKPSAVQDALAAQDTAYAQLSQKPQVSSPAQSIAHAQLSRTPPKLPSSPEHTLKLCLPSDCVMPLPLKWSNTDQRNRHYQADRSESTQPSPAAPTNHNPTSLPSLFSLQSSSVQRGFKSLTSSNCEDGAPSQHSESPPAKLASSLSPRLDVRAMREQHQADYDAVVKRLLHGVDQLVEMCGL
ncbi:hypothetical protein LTR56_018866 [Elasticomyces elasticus]|nr:hypothetical protein LTR56_018866 [Elasticomyces elasticus]KAK3638009.1 hypothetical protein LTR22_017971 [Elasticomyces elasticus]KAK4912953.1 hypothetical protein LTR49_018703 [Elasticomyces elasticus]KAK5749847.1 hypothetical protein LTS12_020065 [Elasticomyces elasticus]